ncbi:MAG: DUF6561 domain-containing protein [Minisyncoccia bacterium]
MSDVKIMRLSTGEDIIAKVIDKDTEKTKLNKAFVIIPHQQGPGKPVQLMMTLYSPYSNSDDIEIKSQNIISMVDPKKEILSSYQQNTSSILTTPGLITETKVPQL